MSIHVHGYDQFIDLTRKERVVVDFSATWCGPCKMLNPIFEGLAKENPDISFVHVDVDENPKATSHFGVSAMPTLVFLTNGNEVARVVGADVPKLKSNIEALKGQGEFVSQANPMAALCSPRMLVIVFLLVMWWMWSGRQG